MALNTYQYRETTMIDPKKLSKSLAVFTNQCLKESGSSGKMWRKIRQTLQAQLTRLDLVSREESDVQTQVLLRTREKLALLSSASANLKRVNPAAESISLRLSRQLIKQNKSTIKRARRPVISVNDQVLWFASSVGNTRHNVRKTRFYVLHPCWLQ